LEQQLEEENTQRRDPPVPPPGLAPDMYAYFDLVEQQEEEKEERPLGRIVIGVYGSLVPETVDNFLQFTIGHEKGGYKGTIFHRIVAGTLIQGKG
tara:strand:- start:28 stop:312 length:285 start_codon:yes stop_codon:yes gene_type:complete